MGPTSIQKYRTGAPSLRISLALTIFTLLLIGYSVAISFIISDRAVSRSGKLIAIVGLSITALLMSGLFERFRR